MNPSQPKPTAQARERRQIVAGLLAALEDRGPHALRESDVIEAAAVTPRTFRAHFDDLDACFDFACEAALDTLLSPMVASWSVSRPPAARLDAALAALLDSLAAQPHLAELCLLRSPARQGDRRTYCRVEDAVTELLLDLRPRSTSRPSLQEPILACGVVALITERLADGGAAGLEGLHPQILALLIPTLGLDGARALEAPGPD